jgi:SAM-dependent methyltransferase
VYQLELMDFSCSICGGAEYRETRVLWPELVAEWQLSDVERDYVDRQQGTTCTGCGASLRLIALGNTLRGIVGEERTLRETIASGVFNDFKILDCNGAGVISAELAHLAHYRRVDYPEYDMQRLPFADASLDVVLHSDTLEHIVHPLLALEECRRILAPSGRLCFTVPIIVGRLSRNRAGLAPSYHGAPTTDADDFRVHTEFGADAWKIVHEAGFSDVTLSQVSFPCAIAMTAWTAPPIHPPVAAQAAFSETAMELERVAAPATASAQISPMIYDQDGLRSVHNHEFLNDPVFRSAYARGVQAAGSDYNWHWRVHTGLWAATTASKVSGDFVEFGVNRGFLSSAIMQLLDWNMTGRTFYLLDTFAGIDERYVTLDDIAVGVIARNQHDIDSGFYTFDLDAVRANFAEWPAARIIPGPVPETLDQIDSDRFAFAHIDMNCAAPEVAAIEFLWPRLSEGGVVLLDDYAYIGYRSQKIAMDDFARRVGVAVLSLPTGQGLIIKPPA